MTNVGTGIIIAAVVAGETAHPEKTVADIIPVQIHGPVRRPAHPVGIGFLTDGHLVDHHDGGR